MTPRPSTSIDALAAAWAAGFPFVAVRPHAQRDRKAKVLNLVFGLDDGPHSYIERIVIRGNSFTRDHVVRREFDITEGDAYNRALVARTAAKLESLANELREQHPAEVQIIDADLVRAPSDPDREQQAATSPYPAAIPPPMASSPKSACPSETSWDLDNM
jgi:hypothetical protein